MKISNNTHRGASIAAAVLAIIVLIIGTVSQIYSLFTNFRYGYVGAEIILRQVFNYILSSISIALLIVVSIRGKKDPLAGGLFVLTALLSLKNFVDIVISTISALSWPNDMIASTVAGNALSTLSNLALIAFYALLALECFNPGKISGKEIKMLLIILPIVSILLGFISNHVRQLYILSDLGFDVYLSAVLLPAVVAAIMNIHQVVLGFAFAIPVYEKSFFAYNAATNGGFYNQ